MSHRTSRRQFLRSALACSAVGSVTGLAGCASAPGSDGGSDDGGGGNGGDGASGGGESDGAPDGGSGDSSSPTSGDSAPSSVALDPVATGIPAPVDVVVAPGGERLYVADQSGRIFVVDDGLRETPALDVRDRIEAGGEKGLLGLALHPEFAENRRVYVRYSAPPREGTPSGYSHTFVLAEFEADDAGTRLRPETERTVLEIPEPQGNHNAGDVAFGPDGYLYVAVGDGGGGGDRGSGHVEDWYDGAAGGNGQDVRENFLGSVLRIDVDGRDDGKPYAVPPDNPLVGEPGLDEHYAWGFRNPWRFSFDGTDLYVGDVGQNAYEEVDLVERGGNYGWNVKEGTHCYGADSCPDATPEDVRGGEPLVDPIVEYPHSGAEVSGISVIGGYVYRGSALPGLEGRYVFGDLRANGRLFVATRPDGDADGLWPTRAIDVEGGLGSLYSFGRAADGELFVLGSHGGESGVFRATPA